MKTFELILSRDGEKIRVCITDKPGQTLRQYEDKDVNFDEINELCKELTSIIGRAHKREDVSGSLIKNLKQIGRDLFDKLLTAKVKTSLLSTSCDTLSLNIDDQLIHIPWELLFDGKQFLCRRFSIGRIVSTRQNIPALHNRKTDTSLRMLVIADPAENLKAAYEEGIRIRDELIGREERIKTDLASSRVDKQFIRRNIRDYDIVHYTGHAEYNEQDPAQSGWIMSDGIWTVSEIRSIAGESSFPFLVFSNACHSGRTGQLSIDSEYEKEIGGLASIFLQCGATHYIGTFHEVPDSPSSTFAVEFYKAIGNNISVGEAVRIAREQLVQQYGESNFIWASYMLYGDPSYTIPLKLPQRPPAPKAISRTYYLILLLIIMVAGYFGVRQINQSSVMTAPAPLGLEKQEPVQWKVILKNIIGIRDENGKSIDDVLSEQDRLFLYDGLQFRIKSNKKAYFNFLINYNHGKIHEIPHENSPLPADSLNGTEHMLEVETHLLRLDERSSAKTIYVLASESKLEDMASVIWEIEKLNESFYSGHVEENTTSASQLDYKIVSRIEIGNGRIQEVR